MKSQYEWTKEDQKNLEAHVTALRNDLKFAPRCARAMSRLKRSAYEMETFLHFLP